jgi:hypothetical protein
MGILGSLTGYGLILAGSSLIFEFMVSSVSTVVFAIEIP